MFSQMMSLQNSPTYRRSLAERLEQERQMANNGTIPGGLASMINAGTAAYLRARDEGDRSKAQKALMGGITEATDIGEMGEDQIPAGPDGALYRLGQLEDNPYAGRLTQMLAFEEMERQREAARIADQRAYESSIYARNRGDQLSDIKDQRQWELSNRPKPQRRIVQGPDGLPYFADDGSPVLPNVQPLAPPQPMTPEQKLQWGLPPDAPYVLENGVPKLLGTPRGPDSVNVEVNSGVPNDPLLETLGKEEGKLWGSYVSAGNDAVSKMQDLDALGELVETIPSGPLTGRFLEMFPEFDDSAASFQSVISRIAPQMRVPGSGATSDKEVNMFLDSLPRLRYNPETNRAIVQMLKNKAQLDIERQNIVTSVASGVISPQEGRRAMAELNQTSVMPDSLRQTLRSLGTGEAPQNSTQSGVPKRRRFNPDTGQFEEVR